MSTNTRFHSEHDEDGNGQPPVAGYSEPYTRTRISSSLPTETQLPPAKIIDIELHREGFADKVKKSGRIVFDTQSLFAIGDWVAAVLAAQFLGVSAFAIAGYVALKGRWDEVIHIEKPGGAGFCAMGVVSALTVVSIGLNGISTYGDRLFDLSLEGPRTSMFVLGAFVAWTAANFLAGLDRSRERKSGTRIFTNHQFWFCVGSICATKANPVALGLFVAGLIQSLRSNRQRDDVQSLVQFCDKHLTPSRCRSAAYGFSAVAAFLGDPAYVLPYLFWMAGNLAFDNGAENSSILRDFKSLFSPKVGQCRGT